jgi:hypothetical protein
VNSSVVVPRFVLPKKPPRIAGEEELQLAQQREFLAAGQTVTQAAASQLKLLRASAQLDESPDAAWDWTITAATGMGW